MSEIHYIIAYITQQVKEKKKKNAQKIKNLLKNPLCKGKFIAAASFLCRKTYQNPFR